MVYILAEMGYQHSFVSNAPEFQSECAQLAQLQGMGKMGCCRYRPSLEEEFARVRTRYLAIPVAL
jgi:hypothetical protein